MTILPVIFVDEQEIVEIPQIPLILHTTGHMAIYEMNCTLVVYAATLKLLTK